MLVSMDDFSGMVQVNSPETAAIAEEITKGIKNKAKQKKKNKNGSSSHLHPRTQGLRPNWNVGILE